jgi:DNA repair protein RadD
MSQPRLALAPTSRFTLRGYQQESIDALYRCLEATDENLICVLPTGSGKSLVLAELVRDACTNWPGTRILILAHVRELVLQNSQELLSHYPEADLGIYSAGLGSRDLHNQVLVASIQSVYRRAFDLGAFDLVLVDEAHLIPRTSDGMYRTFLKNAKQMNPAVRVIGLTATDYRLDSGRLTEGKDRFFHKVAYEANVRDLIRDGYLCRVTTRPTSTQFDLSSVHVRGGEFIPGELAAAVDLEAITRAAVAEIVAAGQDRAAWLVFCSSVAHAGHVAEELRKYGVEAGVVTGETPTLERDTLIRAFKKGELRALVNMNVLTTGFNAPQVDLLAVLRPTKSAGLYVQMIGRGTRNAPGKTNALVLDFGRNIERFGPIDALAVNPGRGKGDDAEPGEAPVKVCPECNTYVLIACTKCEECGHEFPPPAPKVQPRAAKAAILSDEVEPEWLPVNFVYYGRHEKPDKKPSFRVDYRCGLKRVSEWVFFEHPGAMAHKAKFWWRTRAAFTGQPPPETVADALSRQRELRAVEAIQVVKEGAYDRVLCARFRMDSGSVTGAERNPPSQGGSGGAGRQGPTVEWVCRPEERVGEQGPCGRPLASCSGRFEDCDWDFDVPF